WQYGLLSIFLDNVDILSIELQLKRNQEIWIFTLKQEPQGLSVLCESNISSYNKAMIPKWGVLCKQWKKRGIKVNEEIKELRSDSNDSENNRRDMIHIVDFRL
ncbi:MAG: hypothetical protein PF447_13280, partial [Spirochaetaceae bacterium]|nr:hypothetical protein [Spirochaetaceae bacterium]